MSTFDDFSMYDGKVNFEELRGLASKGAGASEFRKLPCGEYCVELSSLILTKSKAGSQMVKGRFKVVNGDDEGCCIYMYQVVQQRFQVDICNSFLRSLGSQVDVCFDDYEQYGDCIKRVWLDVKDRFVYRLYYGRSASGYDTFRVIEVCDADF